MKFKLLNAKLYQWCYDDKETDKICTQIKGTVYEKRISIVPQLDKHLKNGKKDFRRYKFLRRVERVI